MPKLNSVDINLNIPFIGGVKGTWKPVDEKEQNAAWEMYVELMTRISVEELNDYEGILREALNSLYSIFNSTRMILRKYGPEVARKRKKSSHFSFGYLSVIILNYVLRPFLTKWHPLLEEYESIKRKNVSIKKHEDNWEKNKEFRDELEYVRKILITYSEYLAKVADVTPLYQVPTKKK